MNLASSDSLMTVADCVSSCQTKGLSLEEINGKFGDEVVVHFADANEKERTELQATVMREGP